MCSPSSHERLKRDSQWPKLPLLGVQRLGDMVLELRNCEACHSTLAVEADFATLTDEQIADLYLPKRRP